MSQLEQAILPADIHHVDQICHLWRERQTILNQSDARFPAPGSETEVTSRHIIQQRIAESGIVLVGQRQSEVVGYIAGETHNDMGVVDHIALDAHHYHAGLGRALWQAVQVELKQRLIQTIIIAVPRYHAVEQAFWRALGATNWMPESNETVPCNLPPELMWMTL